MTHARRDKCIHLLRMMASLGIPWRKLRPPPVLPTALAFKARQDFTDRRDDARTHL